MSFHKSIIASGATATPAASVEFNLKGDSKSIARPQQAIPQPPLSPIPISTEGSSGVSALCQVAPLGRRDWGL